MPQRPLHLAPHREDTHCHPVSPAPDLVTKLIQRHRVLVAEKRLPAETTFKQFMDVWLSTRRGETMRGLDDGHGHVAEAKKLAKISRPPLQLKGVVRTVVLLVDFPDRPHALENSRTYYQQLLFGQEGEFVTGSMREYYRRVSGYSGGKQGRGIDVQGQVFGWYRMPQPLSYYANNSSGMGDSCPRNSQGLAKDAIAAALADGVDFGPYDVFGDKTVTALFIIHAGSGAEETGERGDIWSHKWTIPGGMKVAPNLKAVTYLTVPEDCKVGVCAHEWGHLVGRWGDYYDTGESERFRSNGLGRYCLMAAGSWGNGGATPVFPNAMLRMFHGWVDARYVTKSTTRIELRPAAEGGGCLIIQNPKMMTSKQYILVEYRRRQFQDSFLPDQGLAIYVVDESLEDVNDENRLAIELMQADGRRHLAAIFGAGNQGNVGDLYCGSRRSCIGESTSPALNLPTGKWTGVTLQIKGQAGDDSMLVDVTVQAARTARRTSQTANAHP